MKPWIVATLLAALPMSATSAMAQTAQSGWSALTSDRIASAVGDSLTVVIVEASSAATSAQSGSRRDTRLSGSISAGGQIDQSGALGLQGAFDGRGQLSRSGRLVGQIGVIVEEVLPGGDLRIAGAQTIEIDGERTAIRINARVRPADISGDNTVLSWRLADARIVYDGDGALSRGSEPGPISRILSWFGL